WRVRRRVTAIDRAIRRDSRATDRVALALLGIASLGLVTTVNRTAGAIMSMWQGLPDSCVASFVVCLAIYFAIRPERPLAGADPRTSWRRVRRLAVAWLAIWLAGSAIVALRLGHWHRYRLASTPAQLLGFLAFGPAQEELLFRGAIFELARRSAPQHGRW